MKKTHGLERAASNFKWWVIGVLSVIALGTASAMYVGGELESALLEKLASDPTGNEAQIYYNTTSKKAKLYNGSAWTDFGSGGAGEINYNDDADGTGNWTDLAAGITVTTTTTEAEIPRWPIKTQAVLLTNDTSGTSGWSVCVEVGESDRNKKLKIEWAQIVSTSPAYASGDFTYQLFSETNDTCTGTETGISLHSVGATTAVDIPAQNGVMYDEFDATDAQYYELKFLRAAGATAATVGINDLVIGPGKLHSGAVVTAWEAFTPVWSNDSGSTYSAPEGFMRREGDSLRIRAYTRFTSPSGSGNFRLDIANSTGHSLSDTYTPTVGRANINMGTGSWYDSSASGSAPYRSVTANIVSLTEVGFLPDDSSSAVQWSDIGASDQFGIDILVAIDGWEGSGVLNTIVQDNLSEWTQFSTPTSASTATESEVAFWKQSGDDVYVRGSYEWSGVDTTTASMQLNLPTGYTVDESKLPTGYTSPNDQTVVGHWSFRDASSSNDTWSGAVVYDDSADTFYMRFPTNAQAGPVFSPSNDRPVAIGDGDVLTWEFSVPITEFAGSQSSLVGFSHATEDQNGLVKRNKWQKKFLSTTLTGASANTTISDLGFTGLTVGKTYRLTANAWFNLEANDTIASILVDNGSLELFAIRAGDSAGTLNMQMNSSTIFVATATTVVFTGSSFGTSSALEGDGFGYETWSMIEELDNYGDESSEF